MIEASAELDKPATDRRRPARILVVDDEMSLREGLAKALRHSPEKFEVQTACDGIEAGMRVGRFQPDIVILDLVMPEMGGLETCRRLRSLSELSNMAIMILTGYPGGGNAETAIVYGADICLTKPQSIESIREHINDLIQTD